MAERGQSGVAVSEGRPSAWQAVPLLLVAAIGYLAVFDAAIESALARPPVSWWVIVPLAAAGLLGLWAWRPGGRLLSRLGPAGAAATPWCILVAAAAAAPWVPGGGQTLVVLLQPPARVRWVLFACVVGAAVLLGWRGMRGAGGLKWRRWAGALVLGAAAVSIGVGAFHRPAPVPVSTPVPAFRLDVAGRIAALSPEERQRVYDAEVAALRSRITRLQAYVDGFPRAMTDVDALAVGLPSVDAAFDFVRDGVALEPYPGSLKGAEGTLVTRGGNSLDRALLLAALFQRKGLQPKIARATLSPEQANGLLSEILAAPSATDRILASLNGLSLPVSGVSAEQGLGEAVARRAAAAAASASKAIADTQTLLKHGAGADGASVAASALADHFWVQATVDGQALDFDPSTRSAKVGERRAPPAETFDPEALAGPLYQRIEFRVVGEWLDGARLRQRDVLKAELRAPDLFGKNIRFAVAPQTFDAGEFRVHAVLVVGDTRFESEPFALREPAAQRPPAGGPDTGAGDMFGALSGATEGETDKPPAPEPAGAAGGAILVRLSLLAVSRGPHLQESTYRRTVLDRLDQARGSAAIFAPLADDRSVRALLVQAWDGAVAAGTNHPAFVLQTVLAAMKGQEPMEEKARARLYLGQPFGVDDLAPPLLPKELIGYYLSSDINRHILSQRKGRRVRWYCERPRLAFARHGFVIGDWGQPEAGARFADGIDLLNSPFRFLGGADASSVARESGIGDTEMERSVARGGPAFNTLPLFAAARDQGIDTIAIDSRQRAMLDRVAVPAPIRRALDEELASGHSLVLPTQLVSLNGVKTFGWWSVDAATGFVIGKMELGGAQGLAEVTKMHERVEKWTEIFAKFYSGLLRCYIDALAENLGATPEALKTFSLKQGGEPGESPMPGMDKLAECVIAQVCDMISELLIEASISPAFADEAEAAIEPLKKIIMNWVKEQAIEKVKGELQGGVAAACEAKMGGGGEGGGGGE